MPYVARDDWTYCLAVKLRHRGSYRSQFIGREQLCILFRRQLSFSAYLRVSRKFALLACVAGARGPTLVGR